MVKHAHMPQLLCKGRAQVFCLQTCVQCKEVKVKEQLQRKTPTQVQEASFRRMKPNNYTAQSCFVLIEVETEIMLGVIALPKLD